MEKLKALKNNVIIDKFSLDGMEIVVINPHAIKTDKDTLALGKIVVEDGENILIPLSDEEYVKAAKRYVELIDIFTKGVE